MPDKNRHITQQDQYDAIEKTQKIVDDAMLKLDPIVAKLHLLGAITSTEKSRIMWKTIALMELSFMLFLLVIGVLFR